MFNLKQFSISAATIAVTVTATYLTAPQAAIVMGKHSSGTRKAE
jgi:hypothetical protein